MRKGLNFRFFRTIIGKGKDSGRAASRLSDSSPGRRRGYRWGRQAADAEKPLSECHEGDLIFIRRIVGGGPVHRRLLEMGMTPGTRVRIIKYAPLNDPLECEVKGYHIALRVAEAQMIIIAPHSP